MAFKNEKKIRDIFYRIKAGEGINAVAKEYGVHHSTIQTYQEGKFWKQLEEHYEYEQSLKRAEEVRVIENHLREHGNRYEKELDAMAERLYKLSLRFTLAADKQMRIVDAGHQKIIDGNYDGLTANKKIQDNGISRNMLDAAIVTRAARENIGEAYGLYELKQHLGEILNRLGVE